MQTLGTCRDGWQLGKCKTLLTCWCITFPQQCEDKWGHLCALADFSIALNESIQEINKHSFNNFELRIGKLGSNIGVEMGFCLQGCDSTECIPGTLQGHAKLRRVQILYPLFSN